MPASWRPCLRLTGPTIGPQTILVTDHKGTELARVDFDKLGVGWTGRRRA